MGSLRHTEWSVSQKSHKSAVSHAVASADGLIFGPCGHVSNVDHEVAKAPSRTADQDACRENQNSAQSDLQGAVYEFEHILSGREYLARNLHWRAELEIYSLFQSSAITGFVIKTPSANEPLRHSTFNLPCIVLTPSANSRAGGYPNHGL